MAKSAKKTPKKLPHLNVRLAWLSKKLAEPVSDVRAVEAMVAHFKITPTMAKRYLDALYEHWEAVAAPEKARGRHRVLEILYRAVEGSEQHFQFSAMVNAADKLAKLYGLYEPEKVQVDVRGAVDLGGPNESALAKRMRDLITNPQVRDRARKLGLDLNDLDLAQSGNDEPDQSG